MNTLKKFASFACLASAALLFNSCRKEAVSTRVPVSADVSTPYLSEEALMSSTAEITRSFDASTGISSVLFRPNAKTGQDAWIEYQPDDPRYAEGNYGQIPEMKTLAWTINGSPVYERFLIKFDSLSKLTADKKIVSAKLILYGLSESPVHLPQGNSCYPGSPYGEDINQMLVQRITSSWTESTVTYNTQPTVTAQNKITTRASKKQWNDDLTIDVTTLVQQMVKNPAGNFGFMFQLKNESPYRSWGFYTSEAGNAANRPALKVIYK